MINIKESDNCCGCFACLNICPKKAIELEEDKYGFKYPVVNKKKCINCGLCERVCPIINKMIANPEGLKAYACYNKNEEDRMNSSSGGIFSIIAKEIIKRKGIVFGASFDDKFYLRHIYIDKEEDISKLMGSKYLQSYIGESYKDVKSFLEKGKIVLFCGTPCQVEGLKRFLNKDYDNLYTQDIICHGVPSPLVWQKYLAYQEEKYNDKVKTVYFRNKDEGWTLYNMKIFFNKKIYSKHHSDDLFMKTFLKNTCLRDSCYNCRFKSKKRISDFTIGDYWGIEKIHPDFKDEKGISLLVINTLKGKKLFNVIKDKIAYIETNLDNAIKYNSAMIESVKMDKYREDFFNNLNKMSFEKLVKKYTYHQSIFNRILNKIKKNIH